MRVIKAAPAAPQPSKLYDGDDPLVLIDARHNYHVFQRVGDDLMYATGPDYKYDQVIKMQGAKVISDRDADKLAAKMKDAVAVNRANRDQYRKMAADVEAVEQRLQRSNHNVYLWDEAADRENASEDGRVDEDFPEFWSRMLSSATYAVRQRADEQNIDIDKELGYSIG